VTQRVSRGLIADVGVGTLYRWGTHDRVGGVLTPRRGSDRSAFTSPQEMAASLPCPRALQARRYTSPSQFRGKSVIRPSAAVAGTCTIFRAQPRTMPSILGHLKGALSGACQNFAIPRVTGIRIPIPPATARTQKYIHLFRSPSGKAFKLSVWIAY
jgi:hypothetical protein